MSIFNFGNRQRLHAQLIGNTSGREMFQVDEYNQRKKTTIGIGIIIGLIATLLYFQIQNIPGKLLIFILLITAGLIWYGYHNWSQQVRLRENLYR